MEVRMETEAGKFETYYIDRITGTTHKVLFSNRQCTMTIVPG